MNENISDFYKTVAVNITVPSERLQSWSITQKYRIQRGAESSTVSAQLRAHLECDIPPEDHSFRKDRHQHTPEGSEGRVTRMVRGLNASRVSSRNQRRLPGHSGVFEGTRGRDANCSILFLIERVRNKDIYENSLCSACLNSSLAPWLMSVRPSFIPWCDAGTER